MVREGEVPFDDRCLVNENSVLVCGMSTDNIPSGTPFATVTLIALLLAVLVSLQTSISSYAYSALLEIRVLQGFFTNTYNNCDQ
jgi:hypothetical protein